jgi:acyl-CoA synthetase (AMP-forming)/AMP-acid ligase II
MHPTPRTVDEMLRRQAAQHTSDSVLSCAGGGRKGYGTYTLGELDHLATLTAHHYLSLIPEEYRQQRVVGMRGRTNIEYIATFLGLQRLGLTCLFLSPGLLSPGCINILDQTECNIVLTQSVADDVMEEVKRKKDGRLVVIPMADSDYLFSTELPASAALESLHVVSVKHPAWYVHSSGSTGTPKALQYYSDGALAVVLGNPLYLYNDVIITPVYHGSGIMALLGCLARGGNSCFLDADAAYFRTAQGITAAGIMSALDVNDAQVLFGVPYALKTLAENPEGLKRLQQLRLVVTVGSPCPDAIGDKLYGLGVNLKNVFALSEFGPVLVSPDGGDWKWLQLIPRIAPFARFEPEGEDADGILYHLVLTTPDDRILDLVPNRPDGGFGTKDLFDGILPIPPSGISPEGSMITLYWRPPRKPIRRDSRKRYDLSL